MNSLTPFQRRTIIWLLYFSSVVRQTLLLPRRCPKTTLDSLDHITFLQSKFLYLRHQSKRLFFCSFIRPGLKVGFTHRKPAFLRHLQIDIADKPASLPTSAREYYRLVKFFRMIRSIVAQAEGVRIVGRPDRGASIRYSERIRWFV